MLWETALARLGERLLLRAGIRRGAREGVIEDRSEGEDVSTRIFDPAGDLFWSHVSRSASDLSVERIEGTVGIEQV